MVNRNIGIAANPARVLTRLIAIFLALLAAHFVGLVLTYGFGHDQVWGLVPLFNIGLERNVPTFFASFLLFFCGLLFLLLRQLSSPADRGTSVWLLLSLTFIFLSIDEFASIHELLIKPVREGLGAGGLLFFAWVIPYGVAVIALAFAVTPFLWSLGGRYRFLFGASAAAYLGGAIGIEMLGGAHLESQDLVIDLTYRLFQTLEESLEFTGLLILAYTLVDLIRMQSPQVTVNIDFQSQGQ